MESCLEGLILYLLMNKMPGVRLTSSFWSSLTTERDEIRRAFRVAYEYAPTSLCIFALR